MAAPGLPMKRATARAASMPALRPWRPVWLTAPYSSSRPAIGLLLPQWEGGWRAWQHRADQQPAAPAVGERPRGRSDLDGGDGGLAAAPRSHRADCRRELHASRTSARPQAVNRGSQARPWNDRTPHRSADSAISIEKRSRIRERGAGTSGRDRRRGCRRRSSARRCTSDSAPAAMPASPTRCFPRCARNSAAMPRSPPRDPSCMAFLPRGEGRDHQCRAMWRRSTPTKRTAAQNNRIRR